MIIQQILEICGLREWLHHDAGQRRRIDGECLEDIEGVKGLKNEMTVAATATPPSQSLSDRIDDASITAQVRMGLWSHRSTSGLKVAIVTTEGDVAVAGVASSQAEKDLVTKLVTDIVAVKSVTNSMTAGATAPK